MDKEQQIRRITDQILNRIKTLFQNHKRKIDKQNSQRTYPGGMMKNQTAQSFYGPIADIVQKLQNLLVLVKKDTKLRKQRHNLYQQKITLMIQNLQTLRKNKHLLKIKINDNMVKLTNDTQNIVQQATNNLRKFQKSASQVCGTGWDYKPAVEKSMISLGQYGFLWQNLAKFQSITNDSVNEIIIPVNYDENQFKSITKQITSVWPNPQIINKQIKVPQVHIKDDTQLRQAHQMLFGFIRSQNIIKAIQIYKNQADKNNAHPTALNALGDIYQNGKFVAKDMNKAVKYYLKSASKNDAQGLYKIGQFLQKGVINSKQIFQGKYPNRDLQISAGIQYYEKAAKLGHLDAMADLGFIYQKGVKNQTGTGYSISPHPDHAYKYYMKTKKSDFPRGYNNLGTLLITCPSLTQQAQGGNCLKGLKYLEKAVQLKYPKAYLNLGKCYENGVGVSQNIDRARSLYLVGSELGDNQCKLNYIKSCLGFRIDDDKTMIKMLEMARQILIEDNRNPQALYYMGLFLEQGIGIEKNIQSSVHYISSSARLQYPPAITKLGDFYYSGFGVKKDLDYARILYEKAAQKGDSKALMDLGAMAEKGIASEKDPKRAYELYQKAASMGNPDALIVLSTTGTNHLKPSDAVNKAYEMGSMGAAKILNTTNIFAPKTNKNANTYAETLKTLNNFYVSKNTSRSRA